MDPENQNLDEVIAGPSTSSSSPPILTPNSPPELQGLATFPLVSPPRRAIFFTKPKEYREYQHPIPPMSPTPLPAHCNSTSWGSRMNQMYPPFNNPFTIQPQYYGAPHPFYANSEELCVPPHAHLNNRPLARLVYRAMRYTPVYQPLLGRNNAPPPPFVPQNPTKLKNATRYLCKNCQKTYATPSGLSKHQQFHCPAGNCSKKAFTCKQCDEVFNSFAALKLHSKTHVLPCKCTLCDKSFSRSWLLQGHMRTHTGEKPYICQQCKRSFADRSNLRAHIQVHNNNNRKYSCSICTKTFTRMSLLMKHTEANCPAHHALMTAIERTAQTAIEKTAQTAIEKTAQTAIENTAQTAIEETAQTAIEKTAQTAIEKTAQTAIENTAQTAIEKTAQL